jgi:hypothetical protein
LEAAVDVAADVGKAEGAVGKIRKSWRGGRIGKVRVKDGGTSRMEQSALMTRWVYHVRRMVWWVEGRRAAMRLEESAMAAMGNKEDSRAGIWKKEPVVAKVGERPP